MKQFTRMLIKPSAEYTNCVFQNHPVKGRYPYPMYNCPQRACTKCVGSNGLRNRKQLFNKVLRIEAV